MRTHSTAMLDALIEPMLLAAKIPGAAIAVVARGETVFARGYGYRDLSAKLPMTAQTVYPIASTTKAINTTLLGMLVDEGKIGWDAPVRSYVPRFQLGNSQLSAQVTIRDLITMRTGLPRHDWSWMENASTRADLVDRLRYFDLSVDFRERFQYNNLTSTTAGYVAELVTGQSWEDLVRTRILEPLGMSSTTFTLPDTDNVSLSYHENSRRELVVTRRIATEVTAPSGGSIHSTVEDMARWAWFNLNGGNVGERSLINSKTLAEIHTPQMVVGADPTAPTPNAAYAMGWFVDFYNGYARVSHGGYLHDVNSEVMLFPTEDIGIVTFTNFGPPTLARQIIQHAFDLLMDIEPALPVAETLAEYERRILENHQRIAAVRRVKGTSPSQDLDAFSGSYVHPGYGRIAILHSNKTLVMRRNSLELPLEHWHYDVWMVEENDLFPIHKLQPFDRSSRILFERNADGEISMLSIQLEPAVAPIRFTKQ